MKALLAAAFGAVLTLASPARAQEAVGFGFDFLDTALGQSTQAAMTGALPAASNAGLGFNPSMERRRATYNQLVEEVYLRDPGAAQQLQQTFAQTDLVAAAGEVTRQLGLDPHNLGDVMAIWLITAYEGSRTRIVTPSPAQARAVANQTAGALAASPLAAPGAEADRQQLAEALLVEAVMIENAIEATGTNPVARTQLRRSFKKSAEAAGMDLTALRLTEGGFVRAR